MPARHPDLLPALLNALRTALFPGPVTTSPQTNTHAAHTVTLTQARRTAALALLDCLPRPAASLLFGPEKGASPLSSASRLAGAEAQMGEAGADATALPDRLAAAALDPFVTDSELTRALAYGVMEAVVLAVVPEMRRAA